ncbi:MAG: hypothetical protein ACD_73C00186G0001, partial [uncultured bacterium]
ATGDVDNNGKDDLLIADNSYDYGDDDAYQYEEGGLYLVYGENLTAVDHNLSDIVGAIWYGDRDVIPTDGIYPRWASLVSDLNSDGFPDIVTTQRNYMSAFLTQSIYTGAIDVIYSSATQFSGVHSLAESDFRIVQDLTSVGIDEINQTIADEGAINSDGFGIGLSLAAVDFNNDAQNDLVFGTLSDYVTDLHQSLTIVSAPFIDSVSADTETTSVAYRAAADVQTGLTVDYNDGTSGFIETFVSTAAPLLEFIRNSGLAVTVDSLGKNIALVNYVTGNVEPAAIAEETFATVETMQELILDDTITEVVITAQKAGKVALTLVHPVPTSSSVTTSTVELHNAQADLVDPAQTTVETNDSGVLALIVLRDATGETVATYSVADTYVLSARGDATEIESLTNNRVRVHYEDGSTQIFTVFATGTGKPQAQLSSDGDRIVVVMSTGRKIRVIDAQMGTVLDGMKLQKSAQNVVQLKVFNYYDDATDEIIVTTKFKQTLHTTGITLTAASALINKNTKLFKAVKTNTYKIVKFKKRVQIQRKNGNIIVQYAVSETAQLSAILP